MSDAEPRALAAEKSRVREERRWVARVDAVADAFLVDLNKLRHALNKAMKREAAETARANYWRAKARALKRELRESVKFAVGCPVCGGTAPHNHAMVGEP